MNSSDSDENCVCNSFVHVLTIKRKKKKHKIQTNAHTYAHTGVSAYL